MDTLTASPPIAEVKRLLERNMMDSGFAPRLRESPRQAMAELGLDWDPHAFRGLWDWGLSPEARAEALAEPTAAHYRRIMARRMEIITEMRDGSVPDNPRLAAWRQRHMHRCHWELYDRKFNSIVFAPFCAELSLGCSVGCWFCGVSAPKLSDLYLHTPENAAFWREVLQALARIFGRAAQWGFCYWATDPLDNPDYEKFMLDFQAAFGRFPQTTTAQPQKHVERMRRIIRLSAELNGGINRFSVLSLKQLQLVHQAFTPAELLEVECLPLNRESPFAKAAVGRARQNPKQQAAQRVRGPEGDTIACVAGLRLNMVRRTVMLLCPCAGCDRWPNGYYVFGKARFADAAHLQALVEGWIAALPSQASDLPRVAWARGLSLEPTAEGFNLKGRAQQAQMRSQSSHYLQRLGQHLSSGRWTADEVAMMLQLECQIPAHVTYANLEGFFRSGWLDEEPPGCEDDYEEGL